MALIKCPSCGKDISEKSTQCIHCGVPIGAAHVQDKHTESKPESGGKIAGFFKSLTKREKKLMLGTAAVMLACFVVFEAVRSSVSSKPGSTGSAGNSLSVTGDEADDDNQKNNDFLELEEGKVQYLRVEPANSKLTDKKNAYVFVFDFTNYTDDPSQVQYFFWIEFYQNGTELKDSVTYSSEGGKQYDLVHAKYSNAMKNGKVTFGEIVFVKDNSPVTVRIRRNSGVSKESTMFEVDLGSAGKQETTVSKDKIEAALQGTWSLNGNKMTFKSGKMTTGNDSGAKLNCTYEINTEESVIICRAKTADNQTVKITIPYIYENGKLRIFNNHNGELKKVK